MTVSPRLSPYEDFWWERDDLHYLDGRLHFAGHDVGALAAEARGPLYLYSLNRVAAKLDCLLQALVETECEHRVYYAMKANRFVPLLQMMARSGKCGVDICSPNELDLALSCGFDADQISFTGTGVANRDLDRLLQHRDLMINCDSIGMIRRIGERQPGRTIGIRVNPGLGTGYGDSALLTYAGAQTTKFGIYQEQWAEALDMARKFDLKITTLHFHVGCGYLTGQLESWEKAVAAALLCVAELPDLTTVNVGGGLGLPHRQVDRPLDLTRWSAILRSHFSKTGLTLAVEPGDFLVKDAGMLVLGVTDIERKRDKLVVCVDGGFNLHPEPAFYDMPCEPVACFIRSRDPADWQSATIAGNINEALDIWGETVAVPPLFEEDFIALLNAGGYGASMSSNHCMRGDFTEIAI